MLCNRKKNCIGEVTIKKIIIIIKVAPGSPRKKKIKKANDKLEYNKETLKPVKR